MNASVTDIFLRDLNAAGRREYIALYFAEHFLGHERFARLLGRARERNRARMLRHFVDVPKHVRRPVPEYAFTSHRDFYRNFPAGWMPAVFRGVATGWPAVRKWDLDFFAREYAATKVVMIDQVGLYSDAEESRYTVSTMDRLVKAMREGERECLRFAPIIDENPELKADLDMKWFDGFRSAFSLRAFGQFFMAPANTYTPIHCAFESNAFLQVHGKKRWLLWPAMYQPLMGPTPDRRPYFHTNYLPDRPSAEYPLGDHAPALEVVLEPGDVMYIPPFVWHFVENLTPTIAIAFRFFSIRAGIQSSLPMMFAKFLATRPSIFHTLVCPRRALDKRCTVPECPFALPDTASTAV